MKLIEAARLALGELSKIAVAMPYPVGRNAITALSTAIEEAEKQEPFGYFRVEPLVGWTDCAETDDGAIALYATTPAAQRQWVGLTEKDFSAINQSCLTKLQAAISAESILKEKNT
jgi:hypothetical protein